MQLKEPSVAFMPEADRRVRMPEPPPVRLAAVGEVELPSVAGLETQLDRFYAGLLRMEREADVEQIVYRAENFRLRFMIHERPEPREDMRPIGVYVPSLPGMMDALDSAEIEYLRQRGLAAGQESLLLLDPAGNWVEIMEMTPLA